MKTPKALYNDIPLARLAGTLSKCLEISAPSDAQPPHDGLTKYIKDTAKGKIDKVLLFNANSVGASLSTKYADEFKKIKDSAPFEVPFLSEYPSLTNACLCTMYTGAHNSVHGIKKYYNYNNLSETIFDIIDKADKKSAIVATKKSAITKIFCNTKADIFELLYDGEVIDKAIELIKEDKYHLIVVFNQEYDDIMHITHPESKQALRAMRTHLAAFELLSTATEVYWQSYNTLIGFAPDHGAHRKWFGLGAHGKYCPDDLNITHYYGVQPKIKQLSD